MSNLSEDEIERRANEIYEKSLRERLETDDNIGKMVIIDAESGDFEVDELGIEAARRLKARRPRGEFYGIRIGYDVVYVLGGSLTRSKV